MILFDYLPEVKKNPPCRADLGDRKGMPGANRT